MRSPAIQHAVAALSELHERFSFPTSSSLSQEKDGWRQYGLSIRRVSGLITTAQMDADDRMDVEEEILIACAIFMAIEILFGNIQAAIRHLKSGISLLRGFLSKRCNLIPGFPVPNDDSTSHVDRPKLNSTSTRAYLDGHLMDLVGFFAVLDMQLMSFFPPSQYVTSEGINDQVLSTVSQPEISLSPGAPSSLYHIVSRALRWTRHEAYKAKYCISIQPALYESQLCLIAQLLSWRTAFAHTDDKEMHSETANLLLVYHLTLMKVHTALSTNECIYQDKVCLDSFQEILRFAQIVLQDRKPERPAMRRLSLESVTIEAIYYLVTKCRDRRLRHKGLSLLQCAGREGVWDGSAMAVVAEHVLKTEESKYPLVKPNFLSEKEYYDGFCTELYAIQDVYRPQKNWRWAKGIIKLHCNDFVPKLVNEIKFNVNRDTRTVNVECGWFHKEEGTWTFERGVLTW